MYRSYLILSLLPLTTLACAKPCLDDGLVQEDDCPSQASGTADSQASESANTTETSGQTNGTASDTTATSGASQDGGATSNGGSDSQTATESDSDSQTGGPTSDGSGTDTSGLPEHCSNGEVDGDETDVDCGGSCIPCDGGENCLEDPDCLSRDCADEDICTTPGVCEPLNDDNQCQACIKSSCCASVMDCLEDEFCSCWLECIEHNNDFAPCSEMCDGTGNPGMITSCANSQCNSPDACGV